MAAVTEVGVPEKAPVVVLKLIPLGADGEIAKLATGPPVEMTVNPVANVLTVRVSEDADSVKAGAAKVTQFFLLFFVL